MRLQHLKELPLPISGTAHSAGVDLYAAIDDPIILYPMHYRYGDAQNDVAQSDVVVKKSRILIPTGIAIALPCGYEAQIRSRSGMAVKYGVVVINAPGTIDADYRGEIFVALINLGDEVFVIERGMRIAQMVIGQHASVIWKKVDNLEKTDRGDGGFGSTGI